MEKERADLGFASELDQFNPAEWQPKAENALRQKPEKTASRLVAEASGFKSREAPKTERAGEGGVMPRRRRTGRNAQFNLKARPDTIGAFCAVADRQGWGLGETLEKAASYAWTSIAFPMLTGTLVTVAGFIPIGLNSSAAGEFTFSLFVVIAVSLVVSWVVAVLFAPLLGVTFLRRYDAHHEQKPGWLRRRFHAVLWWSMRFKWIVIVVTLALFALSVWGMRFVEQQFFPTSDRTEVLVDIVERQNTSIAKTREDMDRLEQVLAGNEDVLFWTSYVGTGAPRFVLAMDVPTPGPYMGQIVIQTPDLAARDRLTAAIVDFSRRRLVGRRRVG